MKITTSAEFNSGLGQFLIDQGNHTLKTNLGTSLDLRKIEILVYKMDYSKNIWDGVLMVHFLEIPRPYDLINRYISHCSADEISMESDNLLRLWWD